jgi:hypothetical protein
MKNSPRTLPLTVPVPLPMPLTQTGPHFWRAYGFGMFGIRKRIKSKGILTRAGRKGISTSFPKATWGDMGTQPG